MNVVWFDDPGAAGRTLVGAKAESLAELTRAGFCVPPGFAVTMVGFTRSLERNGTGVRLAQLFAGVARDDHHGLGVAAATARGIVLDNGLDPDVDTAIRHAYRALAQEHRDPSLPVAVRSSGSDEDLDDASFAGLQDTFLWVRGEDDVVNRVVRCWASLFTDRAVLYRASKGFSLADVSMAVAVQQMVLPAAAGVALTLDPITGDRSKIAIDSVFGLGEGAVSGKVTPDHFLVDKRSLAIVGRTISRKEGECVIAGDRVGMRVLEPDRATTPSISDADLARLARLARDVEAHFGRPQDVEWALAPNASGPPSLFLLQSRPETVWAAGRGRNVHGPGAVHDVVEALSRVAPSPASDADHRGFPSPFDVASPPGADGWAELYPRSLRFEEERRERDESAFWFRDGVHWPRALAPFDVTILQFALTSLSQFNTRYFVLPAAMGVEIRILNGYCYLSPVAVDEPQEVARRAEQFRQRAGHYYDNWDALYSRWMEKITDTIDRIRAVTFEPLPAEVDASLVRTGTGIGPVHTLTRAYHELIDLCLELWQRHFELLNLGYAAYLEFFTFCRRTFPEIPDLAIARMVAGIDVDLFRPDQELRRLARAAIEDGIADLVCAGTVEEALARLESSPPARRWWDDYVSVQEPWFHYSSGSGMYHDDPLWIDHPEIPFGFLRAYVARLERGEEIDTPAGAVATERDRITEQYSRTLGGRQHTQFAAKLALARKVYHYVENHNFYVEHWGHSIFWRKVRELSRVFVDAGVWDDEDAIFMLRREEVDTALWDLLAGWATTTEPAASRRWAAEIERRRRILDACSAWTPPPMLGTAPIAVNEPFTIMLWGITSDSVEEWLNGAPTGRELSGFAASPGVAVGPARVVHSPAEIADVRDGEILVTELTAPSWAPVFRRISGTVTDTGGIMSHAAIVCREYGLPAVTGTIFGTQMIRTGQIVRVNGTTGAVTVLDQTTASEPEERT